jgi:hypothetical protein
VRRKIYTKLVENPLEKKIFGMPRHRKEYDIKVNLKEIGRKGVDWIQLVQNMVH